jgi:hypothetical protein
MNKEIMKQAGLDDYVTSVENGKCPFCKKPIDATTFRDDLSLREFRISGLCQNCQDEYFGK